MKLPRGNIARAAIATSWNYSGRLLGLGWTALLISQLGIGQYGRYAVGIAAAAIVNAAIDNAFYVRSLRIDEERFQRERCARVLFGCVVAVLGVIVFLKVPVAGFAMVVAAGELLFNTLKSRYMRAGRPDVALRWDALRQFVSIGSGAGYLVVVADPHLAVAMALYVTPYAVVAALCLRFVPGRKPAAPGSLREMSVLSSEALSAAVYAQGDLLLLGLLAGDTVAGYYSVALVAAIAVATVGQHYANTFIEGLRESRGMLTAAPPIADVLRVASLTGAVMAAAGVGVLIWGGADQVGWLLVIMSAFVAVRAMQFSLIVVLVAQHRDGLRVKATAAVAAVKMAALVPVIHAFGVYGVAVTAVICDLVLTSLYCRAIFGAGRRTPTREVMTP